MSAALIADVRALCRVCTSPTPAGSDYCSRACRSTEWDCWWTLVRMPGNSPGDVRAKRWARAHLGLDERERAA